MNNLYESNEIPSDDFEIDFESLDLPEISEGVLSEESMDLQHDEEEIQPLSDLEENVQENTSEVLSSEIENQEEVGLSEQELNDILSLEGSDVIEENTFPHEIEDSIKQTTEQTILSESANVDEFINSEEFSENKEYEENNIIPEPIEIDIADDINKLDDNEQTLNEEEKEEKLILDNINLKDTSNQENLENIDEEPISLSDDELDNIMTDIPELEQDLENELETKEKEEEIKISDEELVKTIISDTQPVEEENQENNGAIPPLSEIQINEDDESISLTQEELEHIINTEDLQTLSEEIQEEMEHDLMHKDFQELDEEFKNVDIPEPIFEDTENETISLTDDELSDIVNGMHDFDESKEQDITIPEPEIYETKTTKQREELTDNLEKEIGIKKEELKKIISYLDTLFDQLPDETIRQFSKSEYFNLYKKIIEELKIYPPEN